MLHCQHYPCIAFPAASHVQLCVIQAAPRGIDTGVRYVRMITVMNTVSPFTFSQFEARIMLSVPMLVHICVVTMYVRAYVIGWDDCTNVPLVCYCTVLYVRTYVCRYLHTYVGVVSPSFSTSFHSQ